MIFSTECQFLMCSINTKYLLTSAWKGGLRSTGQAEALEHFPNWLNGPQCPRLMDRAHAFIFRFRQPTTIGQKRPPGYQTKWRLWAEFDYVKTKGIPLPYNYNRDETKVLHEPVAKKQLAFIILKGSTVANRHQIGTIRAQLERAKKSGIQDQNFDFWVNESGTMDEEAHCYMLERHFKHVRLPYITLLVVRENDDELCDGCRPARLVLWPVF